jgi:hypothetical protein
MHSLLRQWREVTRRKALMMQTPATSPACGKVELLKPPLEMGFISEVRTIGLDLAQNVFQVHGADETGAVVFRKQLRRGQVLKFFGGCHSAWLRWKPVEALISGRAR